MEFYDKGPAQSARRPRDFHRTLAPPLSLSTFDCHWQQRGRNRSDAIMRDVGKHASAGKKRLRHWRPRRPSGVVHRFIASHYGADTPSRRRYESRDAIYMFHVFLPRWDSFIKRRGTSSRSTFDAPSDEQSSFPRARNIVAM